MLFADPKTEDERSHVATSCVRDLKIEIPALLDDARNSTERAYTGWPDRLYLIDRQGKVRFKSKPGPFGFHVTDLARAVKAVVQP